MRYFDIVIENSNENTDRFYTYTSCDESIKIGSIVKVPFARTKRLLIGVVMYVHDTDPKPGENINYRQISEIDEEISLNAEMVCTAIFLRARYLCRYMEALNLFLPSGKPSKTGKKRLPYAELAKKIAGKEKKLVSLSKEQQKAFMRINELIQAEKTHIFLIQGVTGSGKTELYMESIDATLKKGKSAIVVVPEIALTAQLVVRFALRFGLEQIAVLHSKLSNGQRYDEWKRIRNGEARIVLGARSAIFAPLENIGVIVLDEEHESSYKSDQSPKYETVDIAVKRASEYGATVLLGSATPSVVSRQRAKEGIYERINLNSRYNGNELPKVKIVDMGEEIKLGNRNLISSELYESMQVMLKEKRQIILFLNRRGYSTVINCKECGNVMKCPKCDITLTYHKEYNAAVCHYCGEKFPVPNTCNSCGSTEIAMLGMGTEKVFENIESLFPEAKIDRLDLDTARKKGSIEKTIERFQKQEIDILIGTQIIAKGLDFENVGLVGVILADTTLNIPDFRSGERTFQLITQVVGRAGRGEKEGRAIVQTYQSDNFAIRKAACNDYEGFFEEEIKFRKLMNYPPFCDLVQLVVISGREETCKNAAQDIFSKLLVQLSEFGIEEVFMPQKLLSNFEKEHFRYGVLIKCPKEGKKNCMRLLAKYKFLYNTNSKLGVRIAIDINPY